MGDQLIGIQLLTFVKQRKIIEKFFRRKDIKIVDTYVNQLRELFQSQYPGQCRSVRLFNKFLTEYTNNKELKSCGVWVWYAWRGTLVHLLDEKDFQHLRTARNKYLIRYEEQKKFERFRVAIAGLSIGSNIATILRMQGGAKSMKLADLDSLEVSNTNRIRVSLTELGEKKTAIVARQIFEIDPFSQLTILSDGLNKDNVEDFCKNVDIIFDEVDDIRVKIQLRIQARKNKIPLVMLTDNDDGVLIDYYPYHKVTSVPLFYGLNDKYILTFIKSSKLNKKCLITLSSRIVGLKNISDRMLLSLKEVSKSIYSWPQLGTAAFLVGVIGSYMTRMISVGKHFKFKRYLLRLNDLIK